MIVGPVVRDQPSAEFFDGTARGEFLLRRCLACEHLDTPQAQQCGACSSTDLGWAPASGDATLVTWAVNHSKPDASGATVQSVLGVGQLAEGPWWWTQVIADRPDLAVGLRLRIAFIRHDEECEAVPVFVSRTSASCPPQ